MMFGNELTIGSIRAQSNRLKDILAQLESDERWHENCNYYATEIHDVERHLKIIRKIDFERAIDKCNVY